MSPPLPDRTVVLKRSGKSNAFPVAIAGNVAFAKLVNPSTPSTTDPLATDIEVAIATSTSAPSKIAADAVAEVVIVVADPCE